MLSIRDTLMWYKRPEVRKAMLLGARDKEIGVRYGEGFGKRPDALEYEDEILQNVQRGATSFHASEELWTNPRSIETGMSKERTHELRTGWDLILDIDFTDFEATKRITHALCRELESHGVYSYGVKFSGNKGFHIGVPWQAFPPELSDVSVAQTFPDAARAIANFLVYSIDCPENDFALSHELLELLGAEESRKHRKRACATCGTDRKDKKYDQHWACTRCGNTEIKPADFDDVLVCSRCRSLMDKIEHKRDIHDSCERCGGKETREVFDLKIDTQLVSSRHLYRLEYSLHEKSGLVSLPIQSTSILSFNRAAAQPEAVVAFPQFLNRAVRGEGYQLYIRAQAFSTPEPQAERKEIVWSGDAAPEDTFPPCMRIILQGLKDGKKRSTFVLVNFLQSVGWTKEMIEDRLAKWNEHNDEPLREVTLKGSIRYHIGKKVLPPNCDNKAYYVDFNVCKPDHLCSRIKNPVQYVRLKMRQAGIEVSETKEPKAEKTDVVDASVR